MNDLLHVIQNLRQGLLLATENPRGLAEWGTAQDGWLHTALYLSATLATLTAIRRYQM